MARLFAFGDSFTDYPWLTWADILGQEYAKIFNFGLSGSDNFLIFSRFNTAIIENLIKDDDIVIIQWSEPFRLDFVIEENNYWAGLGSGSAKLLYKKKLDCFINNETTYYRSLLMMCSAIKILEDKGINWYFFFMNNKSIVFEDYKNSCNYKYAIKDDFDFLIKYISQFSNRLITESIVDFQQRKNYEKKIDTYEKGIFQFSDSHPLPHVYLEFLEEKLDIKFKSNLRTVILNIVDIIIKEKKCSHENIDKRIKKILKKNNLKISKTWFERHED